MFSPSTAPRWKRQTRTGRSDGLTAGRPDANAARARKSGSRPRLTSARPPDFTKTRLEMVIVSGSPGRPKPSPRRAPVLDLDRLHQPAAPGLHFWYALTLCRPSIADRSYRRAERDPRWRDRKSTRLNSSHLVISYAV